ncbi:MAG: hypothetical protein CML17_13930, partial [Pusillimonas sp.]|nr:hypothetical protein [Pusillimonas sp.]
NRLANQQKFFKDSENTIFTFDSQANREAVLSLNDLLQVNIDIDFPGAIVAASLFAKVTGVSGATANVKLFGGNYKSTSEVAKASSQTALTTNFSVNKINTGSYMSLAGGTGVDALLDSTRTTTTDTFSLSFASPHNLELNDTITLITNSTKGFKAAEVAFVKEKTSNTQAKFVYGRVFEPASNLNLGDLSPSSVVGVLKGSIDPLHDFTAGDQLMHFNADNAGRYKSYQIGPGSEVGADCIAIGKNVYNNQASSIKIGYDNNMLNIHSTGIDVAGKVKTTGIINGSTHATAEPITYDAKEHRFRDFDTNPNNLMVISKRDGSPIGKIGINKDCPVSALHIVGGSTTGGGISNEALRVVGSGLFTSTNDTALILQADSNNNCPVENPILRLRQDGFASSTKREVDVGINSNNNSHFRGAKKDAFYIHRKAGTGETHNTPSIQFAIDENDVMTLRGGTTSDNAKVGINTNSPSVELDIRGNSGNGIAKMRILGAASETAEIEAGGELKIGSDGTNGYITAPRYALHVGAQTSNIGIHANLVGTTNNYPSDLTAHPYIRFVKSDSGNANFNRGIEFNGPVTSHVRFFRLGKGIQNYNSGGAHLPLPDIAGAKSTDMGGGISIVNAEVNAPDTNGAQQNFKAAHYHGIGIWSTNQFDVSSKGKLVRIYTNSPSNTSPTLQVATDVVTILKLVLPNIPTHANETAAASAGLAQNTVYKTSTGELRIKL